MRPSSDKPVEGITHQPPKPPSRSTWILETLTPQNRKINVIFAILRVFSIIWGGVGFSKEFEKSRKFW
jgi:hypothetical protein